MLALSDIIPPKLHVHFFTQEVLGALWQIEAKDLRTVPTVPHAKSCFIFLRAIILSLK